MMVLNSGYRRPLTYNERVIEQAEKALERLRGGLRPAYPNAAGAPREVLESLEAQIQATRQGFEAAMDDDFNTAGALGHLFDLVRAINQARDAGATQAQLHPAQSTLRELMEVLGLRPEAPQREGGAEAAPFIDLLVEVRTALRQARQWELAARIRDRLAELGVALEDGPQGTTWRWAK